MTNYDLDVVSLAIESMPPVMRQPLRLALLRAMLKPVLSIQERFLAEVTRTRYLLGLSGRVIDLAHWLNDEFDRQDRRIYIEDGFPQAPVFLYTRPEGSPLDLYTRPEGNAVPLYRREEFETQYDFIIHVPPALLAEETTIRAAANRYVSAGRRYIIQAIP